MTIKQNLIPGLFGFESGVALVTAVGTVNRTQGWYEANAGIKTGT